MASYQEKRKSEWAFAYESRMKREWAFVDSQRSRITEDCPTLSLEQYQKELMWQWGYWPVMIFDDQGQIKWCWAKVSPYVYQFCLLTKPEQYARLGPGTGTEAP